MKVTELNEGKKIAYAVKKTVLTLDGGRIALDLQKYQKDYPVTLDFMTDGEGNMLMNAFDSLRAYVAEIRLPAYETETVEVEDEEAKDGTEEAAEDTTPADEQAAAEDHAGTPAGAGGRLHRRPDVVQVVDGPVDVAAGQVAAGHGRHERHRARGQHQHVVVVHGDGAGTGEEVVGGARRRDGGRELSRNRKGARGRPRPEAGCRPSRIRS